MSEFKESELVNKWINTFHRSSLQWRRVRLGQVASKEEAKLYSVILRWADALFVEDGFVYIVEAKLRPDLGTIGQLEGYKDLFFVTPEFSQYHTWPVKLILLSPMMDLNVAAICDRKGIEYVVWSPGRT